MNFKILLPALFFLVFARGQESSVSVVVLGTVQDGGSPHIGCKKECCVSLFENPDPNRKVVSLGVIDDQSHKTYLFEATPDVASQLKKLKKISGSKFEVPDGIFLTHAHMGHYSGLLFLGREALGASKIPVYVMPKMKSFLETNGPWSQLVTLENISLKALQHQKEMELTQSISVIPFTVPHRDEFSETVGFKIIGPHKSVLFIPDIDKWSKWESSIIKEIEKVDFAFLDATFYDGTEINNRDISEIPHPFVVESIELFESLPSKEKDKIHFIHFNHTNPLLTKNSKETESLKRMGFHVSKFGKIIKL